MTHVTAVVDEAGHVPIPGGIDDVIVIHSEEVAAPDARCLVPPLSLVGHRLSHDLSHVLYDHLISCYVLDGKKTPVVDGGFGKLEQLLPCLREGEREGGRERERKRERERASLLAHTV